MVGRRLSLLILISFCLSFGITCERRTQVTLRGGERPTFELSGNGTLERLQVDGPAGPEWVIVPENLGDSVGRFEGITYGEVPPDYQQTIPARGTAQPLVEGKNYSLTVYTTNAPGARMEFIIRDGQAVEKPGTKEGNSTGP